MHCGLPVLSKEQVLEKYGTNFDLWITPHFPARLEIETELLETGFVDESRILNGVLDRNKEEYLSCVYLRYNAVVGEDNLCACCSACMGKGVPPRTMFPEYNKERYPTVLELYRAAVRDFLAYKKALIEDLRTGKPCICDGCACLKRAHWNDYSGNIETISFGLRYPCQLSCIYCDDHSLHTTSTLDLAAMVQAMELEGMKLNYPVDLASGEITICPQRKSTLDILSKYPLHIYSNGVVFDEQVAKLIARNDGSFINVSLDAGTAETYHRVKGVDVYEKVLTNLRRYSAGGATIEMKYILLPENCSRTDIDGFLKFSKEVGAAKIMINHNIKVKTSELSQDIIDAAVYMVKQARALNLRYEVMEYFGDRLDYIQSKSAG